MTLPLATVLGGLVAHCLLLPVLRLRGIYFSMVTLVLPLMLVRVIEATKIFGGTEGISGLAAYPNRWVELYLDLDRLSGRLFGFRRLLDSDYGLVLKGICDNDRSVMSSGINIYWYKAQALFMAGSGRRLRRGLHDPCLHVRGHAGLCPGLLHPSHRRRRGGGPGHHGRAAAGRLYPGAAFRSAAGHRRACASLFTALFLMVFIVALPEGIFHYIQRKYQQFERWVEVEK